MKEEVMCDTGELNSKRQRQYETKKPDVQGGCHGN